MSSRQPDDRAAGMSGRQRERVLTRALDLAPDRIDARLALAILLFGQRRNAEALPHFRVLVDHSPRTAAFRASLAVCTSHIGDYRLATLLYEECREAFKQDMNFQVDYAEALKYAGRRDESVAVLRSALETDPGSGLAWWALANVKTEAFSVRDIQTMLHHVAGASPSKPDAYHFHYALGRAFEQAADYETSFAHYASGAALKRAGIGFDEGESQAVMRRTKQFFSASRLAGSASGGCPDPAPIFIVGMPRAGSTLVEQILASHSQIEGTMELPEMSAIVRDLDADSPDCRYPESLAAQDDAALASLGRRYIDNTRPYRKTDKPYFTDKMPSNCLHVGLIHLILPNARIIDVRRDPLANCLAVFKQLFGHGVGYSYDFGELARYHNRYVGMMSHFDDVLPDRVCHVRYEDLVCDTETEIRRLLAHCGLEFEPACLRFWENDRAVATPSAEQVRRPIFRDGLDSWRNFEPWLGPLKQNLLLGEYQGERLENASGIKMP